MNRSKNTPDGVRVRVPATSANLGPGFDCLGIALDLWNAATFIPEEQPGVRLEIQGEGEQILPRDEKNQIALAFLRLCQATGKAPPPGLTIRCENSIPLSSGLGSSSAAIMTGLLGANLLTGEPLSTCELLDLANAIEGHPDNVAPALLGGLVIAIQKPVENQGLTREEVFPEDLDLPGQSTAGRQSRRRTIPPITHTVVARKIPTPPLTAAIAVPALHLPTREARRALPTFVPMQDAVFNVGRTALVVEALRSGDLELLRDAMEDRLHQPYRNRLMPGAENAIAAARIAGAAAAISGAGPSVIAFAHPSTASQVASLMVEAFRGSGIDAREMVVSISAEGSRS
jgi:homoserine kinase